MRRVSQAESGLVRHKQKTLEMYKYILGGRNAHMTIKKCDVGTMF